jgi:hypothetical protein
MKATGSPTYLGHASVLAALLLILASLACNLGASSAGNQTEGDQPEDTSVSSAAKPAQEPNPLRVSVTLDTETRTAEVIPVSGGTITATGIDGTKYTLVIPENALLSDQEIRMTPVSSIDGLPFGNGEIAAVDLKPDGLAFLVPAMLTIQPPQGISPKDFVGFSYLHEGEELFLYPYEATDTSVTISVMHFTGYGGGSDPAGDSSSMAMYPPSSSEGQALQKFATAIQKAKLSGGAIPVDEFRDILLEWYETSVYPNLVAAASDDSKLESSILEFGHWLRNVEPVGLTNDFYKQISRAKDQVHRAMNNAIKQRFARCTSQTDPINVRRLMRLVRLAYLAQYFGTTEEQGDDALDKTAKCAKFELQFTSRIENLSGCQSNFISQVKATVPLKVGYGMEVFLPGSYEGEAPLEYVEFSPPSGCPEQQGMIMCPSKGTGKTNSTFSVISATLFNLNYSEEADSTPPKIMIEYDPGTPVEKMSVQCPQAEPVPDIFKLMEELGLGRIRLWRNAYDESHKDEGGGPFYAVDWDYSGGSLYARKVYQGKSGETPLGFSFFEDTTMDIFFKPGGGK